MKIKSIIKIFPVFTIGIFLASCSKKKITPSDPQTIALKTSYTINSVGLYPESFDYDNKNHRFIVGSFNKGAAFTLNTNGDFSPFINDSKLVGVTGIYADLPRNRVIVLSGDGGSSEKSTSNKSGGSIAYAGVYDLTTGNLIKGVDLKNLTPNAGAFPNDATVDKDGNIYVTDSFSPVIYKIDLNYTPSIFVSDSRFSAPTGTFGLNGIVIHPDGYLLVAKTDNGKLFKIQLANPKAFTEVSGFTANTPDGLELKNNGDLVVVENGFAAGQVYTLVSKDNWVSTNKLNEITIGKEAFPTAATVAEQKDVYILATTKIGLFLAGDKTQTNFIIQKLN